MALGVAHAFPGAMAMASYVLTAEIASFLFSAIGEIASAYVAIAASNRAKHMCNGHLHR